MHHRPMTRRCLGFALSLSLLSVTFAGAADDFRPKPTWSPVKSAEALSRLEEYLRESDLPPTQQADVRDHWRDAADTELLDRLVGSLAEGDERVAKLVEFCARMPEPGPLPDFSWLADSEAHKLVRYNVRLFLARWLVQHGYHDEAIEWTDGLTTEDVVAPDVLLFYRAVAHHRLVEAEKADSQILHLLTRESDLPLRYQKLAELMRKDLASLEDESLDHISRRMEDVRRRLAHGRSGERVQGVENGVIESLDKLIKDIEDQMQQQAQSAASQPGGQPSGSPMQESHIAELKGPGKVDRRDIGRGSGWGNLDDKEREKALQEVGREFPSHYREVIEEYFRRLAAEQSSDKP